MEKKYMFILLIAILFTTGCNCEYNLTIHDDYYKEEINIIADNETESSQFNLEWQIPTNKNEYNMPGDPDSLPEYSDIYNYRLKNKILTFDKNFTINEYNNSSAVSVCFYRFKVYHKEDTTIISTRSKIECFDKYQQLNNITVNIKTDNEVINNDADKVNNGVYTWYINRSNSNDKAINLTFLNEDEGTKNNNNDDEDDDSNDDLEINDISNSPQSIQSSSSNLNSSKNQSENNYDNYIMYIILVILLIIIVIGYLKFYKISKENNKMDD